MNRVFEYHHLNPQGYMDSCAVIKRPIGKAPFVSSGFTLIELSIVLVIIGLIVGGVMVGQDLIQQAKLRKVLTEVEAYNTAAMTFKLKFNHLPGDLPNASQFWPTECSVNATRCTGNGDRKITLMNTATVCREDLLFWHELVWAGLSAQLPENTWNQSCNTSPAKTSLPRINNDNDLRARLRAPGEYILVSATWWPYFPASAHSVVVSGQDAGLFTNGYGSIPTAHALSMDQKIDDGHPRYGNVHGEHTITGDPALRNCLVNTGSRATTTYNLAYTQAEHSCQLRFGMKF